MAATAALRILHVDDEPDIREIVELSLAIDPAFTVRSCASGREAITAAEEWPPDIILCDVMMPVMDGPATLVRLRESSKTANIPVVFMTARAQGRELAHFKSLGATGVIAKPFDPMTLASAVRGHLRTAGLAALRDGFVKRLRADAAALTKCRADLENDADAPAALGQIRAFAHALAGAAGIFGFQQITLTAATLEKAAAENLGNNGDWVRVGHSLDALLAFIQQMPESAPD
jgi:two-component system OmpR family response regulator